MKTLADKAQAWLAGGWQRVFTDAQQRQIVSPNVIEMRTRLRKARRFTLSNDFVEMAVRAATVEDMRVIFSRCILARLPFENVWIEFDQQHRAEIQMKMGTSEHGPAEDRGVIGYLMTRPIKGPGDWAASPFLGGRDAEDMEVSMGMVSQALGQESPAAYKNMPDDLWPLMVSGWGFKKYPDASFEEHKQMMFECFMRGNSPPELGIVAALMASLHPDDPRSMRLMEGYESHARQSAGDLRFLITVLALLNVTPVTYSHVPATGRFTHRLKTMDYLDTHTVSLSIGGGKAVKIMDRAARKEERAAKRRHEVRGTWRVATHNTSGTGCRHLPVDGTLHGDHATCGVCGHRIRWVKDHMRGDANVGFVQKDYEVEV